VLIRRARQLYGQDPLAVTLEQTAYALDSTTIDLCLSLFPWARFRRRKGAVKLHTLLDLRGNIPCFVRISDGKVHDVTVLDHLPIGPGAFYVMDRGYVDFQRLYKFTQGAAFFVTRVKRELRIDGSLNEILQILSVTLFEKTPLFQALTSPAQPILETRLHNQLTLFDI
jgi:hypothetical protein